MKLPKGIAGSWRQLRLAWVTVVVIVLLGGYPVVRYQGSIFSTISSFKASGPKPSNSLASSSNLHVDSPVEKLINSIRQATETARTKSGSSFSFSAKEKNIWKQNNPCRSRQELQPMYAKRGRVMSSPQWDLVLQEYSILHRTCIQAAGNLTEYFTSRNESTGCEFFLSSTKAGLGNKIIHAMSSLVYSVLTQRVLIIPSDIHLTDVMCEPFEGSSWKTNFDGESVSGLIRGADDVLRGLDSEKAGSAASDRVYASQVDDWWEPVSRFYCDTEQEYLSHIPLLAAHGMIYYIPKLFSIPSFRPVLEGMFPDPSLAATTLLRSVMLPGDRVWNRFKSVHRAYLENGDTQVGFQLRFFKPENYEELNKVVNDNIMNCSLRHGFLPDTAITNSTTRIGADGKPKVIKLFIASLFIGLRDFLTSKYLRDVTVTGDSISIVQLTEEKKQEKSLEVDNQALVEILGLSFSDTLFVSGFSTFGSVSQAYGGIVPWYVSFDNDTTKPSCTRGKTVDICEHRSDAKYRCVYEPELHEQHISEFVPYLKACSYVDAKGQQLVKPAVILGTL